MPRAPLGGAGGQGDCYPEYGSGAVSEDLGIVSKALADPLYPIRPALRLKLVEWISMVVETSTDDRVRAKAWAILASVEGHNLAVVRLKLEEQRLKLEERRMGLGQQAGTGPGIVVVIEADAGDESGVPSE